MLDEVAPKYATGFQNLGGIPSAVGGGILLFIALISKGKPISRGLVLVVSVLCGIIVQAGVCRETSAIISEMPTYSSAFGFWVSMLGAVLGIIGSLVPVFEKDLPDKRGVVILAALWLFVVIFGFILIAYPRVGVSLGAWETPKRSYACLRGINQPQDAEEQRLASCAATAEATHPSPTLAPW